MKIPRKEGKLPYILLLALMLSSSHAADSITTAQPSAATTSTTTATAANVGPSRTAMRIIPNSYIVTCSTAGIPSGLTSSMSSLQGTVTTSLDGAGVAVISSSNPNFATDAAKIDGVLSVLPDMEIQWIDPNWSNNVVPTTVDNPPYSNNQNDLFNIQWGLDAINAPEAWKTGYRGRGALVAVLDTGIDVNHPDIKPNLNLAKSKSFVPGEGIAWSGPSTTFSHSTHVSGIIAGADNDVGIVGVAPEAKIMLVKVLSDANGSGQFTWILAGMKYAIDQEADVINMSLGGYIPNNAAGAPYIEAFKKVMEYAQKKCTTVIASAGNDAYDMDYINSLGYFVLPAQAPNVLAISATAPIGWAKAPLITSFDNLASYTNYGSFIDLAAPGGDLRYAGTDSVTLGGVTAPVASFDRVVSSINGGWAWARGTSMAAPHVTGVAALLIGKNGGYMSPDQLRRILQSSSDDLGDPEHDVRYGYGRVNAYRALALCGPRTYY